MKQQPLRSEKVCVKRRRMGRLQQGGLHTAAVPTPVLKSEIRSVSGKGLLGAAFDAVDLLPQGLVGANVLRECLQSRDTEL